MRKASIFLLLPSVSLLALLAAEPYNERFRPQFHFSPQTNWTNDPCGLVYAFGSYHLFFQHNLFANVWGHMSWGHAVSPDLIHWKQMPVAIPDDNKVAIFTGSSVFDAANTSGLCASQTKGCVVSIYTGFTPKTGSAPEHQTQNLAVSQDGVTWTKYSANPVLDLGRGDTRDPKVFWHEPTRRWILVMVLADEKMIRIFNSTNLKQWKPLSDFGPQASAGGQWECPDLYQLPVEGQPGKSRWILKIGLNPGHIAGGSGEQYFIGQFDGTRFRNDNPPNETRWLDYGRDCYCSLTFNNEPRPEAPRMIGWMSNWQYAGQAPTSPWRGAMTLPRTLSLGANADGSLVLKQSPFEEIQKLRERTFQYNGEDVADLNGKLSKWPGAGQTFELEALIQRGSARQITWKLLSGENDETVLSYDATKGEVSLDRSRNAEAHFNAAFPSNTVAPLKLGQQPVQLRIFVDRSSVEVFAQNGKVVLTNLVFPKPASNGISLSTSGGRIGNIQLNLWKLRSAWKEAN